MVSVNWLEKLIKSIRTRVGGRGVVYLTSLFVGFFSNF